MQGWDVRDGHVQPEAGVGARGVADPLRQAARGRGEAVAVGWVGHSFIHSWVIEWVYAGAQKRRGTFFFP